MTTIPGLPSDLLISTISLPSDEPSVDSLQQKISGFYSRFHGMARPWYVQANIWIDVVR